MEDTDGNESLDIVELYRGIFYHTFDSMEPYVAMDGDRPIRAQVGKSQTGKSDYIPLSVMLVDAAV